MADIELVVKLPKRVYNYIRKYEHIANIDILDIKDAIIDGTPLPKGHGRLIDADALYEKSRLCHTEEDGTACVEWREINDAPTIIEGSESE